MITIKNIKSNWKKENVAGYESDKNRFVTAKQIQLMRKAVIMTFDMCQKKLITKNVCCDNSNSIGLAI